MKKQSVLSGFLKLLFFGPYTLIVTASILTEMEKPVPIRNVEAVLHGTADLPCDILPEDAHDDVYLVLWFKGNATKPMYSLDVRGKPLNQASHWAESSSVGRRTSFRTQSSPNSLMIEELSLEDEGTYRCRVDYRNSPTKNVKLNLTIIVPPEKPVVRDRHGQELLMYDIGPYEIEQDLILECEVSGGNPLPKVTWWTGGVLYDSSDEVTRSGVIVNRMVYKDLQRQDLGKKFQCQAFNTNLTMPVSREVKVVLNLKPTSVSILEKRTFVSAGKLLEVVCQTVGGHPPPKITWWLGSRRLKHEEEASYNGVSKSTLRYVPAVEDDGRYLTCRAENEALKNEAMEDQWTIQVHYAPQVSLRLGRTLDPDNIRTGHDVYFECDIKSNPAPLRLEWLLNGRVLQQNMEKGIIMSTQSLVLQSVGKTSVGDYTCRAVNSEGAGESNPIPLKIMYAPICQTQLVDQLIGVTAEESISINCRVDAYPAAVTFSWFFNNSEHREEIDESRFSTDGVVSTLNFTPASNQDYGTLYCTAQNPIGHQQDPCTFQIVPTGRPAPLSECRLMNHTLPSLRIGCREGFDGGLPQTFQLEVYENDELKTKVSNAKPNFDIAYVPSGLPVKIYVYAQNSKGTSEPFIIEETFAKHSKHLPEGVTDSKAVKGSMSGLDFGGSASSIVVIVTGVAAGLVFTVLLVCLFVTCKKRRHRRDGSPSPQTTRKSSRMSQKDSKKMLQVKIDNKSQGSDEGPPYDANTNSMLSDLDSSSLLLASRRTSVKGTLPRVHTPATSTSTLRSTQDWHHQIPVDHTSGSLPPPISQHQQQQQHLGFDIQPTSCHVVVGGTLGRRQPGAPGGTHLSNGVHPGQGSSSSSLYLTMSHHPGGTGRFHEYATLGTPRLSPGGSRGSSVSGPSSVQGVPSGGPYPMYHTCERQKKRVTIMEDNNTESSV